jgi:hypothetical protein
MAARLGDTVLYTDTNGIVAPAIVTNVAADLTANLFVMPPPGTFVLPSPGAFIAEGISNGQWSFRSRIFFDAG